MTVETELGAWDWLAKVNEKLTFLRLSILERKEITDQDYEFLKPFYGIWWRGELPLYQTKLDLPVELSTQNTLFADRTADDITTTCDGISFAEGVSETNNNEEEDDTDRNCKEAE